MRVWKMSWKIARRENKAAGVARPTFATGIKYRCLLLCWAMQAGLCSAQDLIPKPPSLVSNWPQITESDKLRATATGQIYTLTYLIKKRCHSLGYVDSAQLDLAIDRFRSAYPEVMRLVDESPYLAVSSAEFESYLDQKGSTDVDAGHKIENFDAFACRSETRMLNQAADEKGTPAGNKMAAQFISALTP